MAIEKFLILYRLAFICLLDSAILDNPRRNSFILASSSEQLSDYVDSLCHKMALFAKKMEYLWSCNLLHSFTPGFYFVLWKKKSRIRIFLFLVTTFKKLKRVITAIIKVILTEHLSCALWDKQWYHFTYGWGNWGREDMSDCKWEILGVLPDTQQSLKCGETFPSSLLLLLPFLWSQDYRTNRELLSSLLQIREGIPLNFLAAYQSTSRPNSISHRGKGSWGTHYGPKMLLTVPG